MSPHIFKTYKVKKKKTKIYEVIKSHNLPNIMLVCFFKVENNNNDNNNNNNNKSKVYTGWHIPYDSRHNYSQYFFRQIT